MKKIEPSCPINRSYSGPEWVPVPTVTRANNNRRKSHLICSAALISEIAPGVCDAGKCRMAISLQLR